MAWQFDPAHSELAFSVKHMMVSTVRGRFRTFTADLALDEQQPTDSHVNVTIDMTSIDTGADGRDAHLRSPDFFDTAQYPTATFTSSSVERVEHGEYRVTGHLTLHGVTRPVTLRVAAEGPHPDIRGIRRFGFEITGAIDRKDFGLGWNAALEAGGWAVSDTVKLQIEVEVLEPAAVTATV